ncbi:hypothetical protein IAU59_005401 [Kwoniella sp. CBS 9459]
MGGNAFGITARRLPQAQYDAVKAIALAKLQSFFSAVLVPRNLTSKDTHGDLDVLCAYDNVIPNGDEAWFANEQITNGATTAGDPSSTQAQGVTVADGSGIADAKIDPVLMILPESASGPNSGGRIKIYGGRIIAGPEVETIRNLCGEIRQSLGATAWWRRGSEVSYKLPCIILGQDAEEDVSPEEFYQIDINFVKAACLNFYQDMASYSSTGVLLGRIVRHLSKSFTLHLTHFVIRHNPFPGLPSVDVTLTSSPSALTAWLGLDYDRWAKEGEHWSEEKQLFEWMTDVKDDSVLGPTLKRLGPTVRRDPNEETGKRKRRADYADRFYNWLRTESKWAAPAFTKTDEQIEDPSAAHTPISSTPIGTPADLEARTTQGRTVSLGDFFSQSAEQPGITTAGSPLPAFYVNLDPAPRLLDPAAQAALDHWGKKEEYDRIVAMRREAARDVARMQFEKQQRREAAALGDRGTQ